MCEKVKDIITICALAGLTATLFYGYTVQKNAIREIEKAQKEADEANDRFVTATKENEKLASVIAGYQKASETESKGVQEAEAKHEERDSVIDKAPDCWTDVELPECVREAFNASRVCPEDNGTTASADGTVSEAKSEPNGN